MRRILFLAALFIVPGLFAQSFGYYPEWVPGWASNDTLPIIILSDNEEVTHTIKSGEVTLGINASGGGYINYCDRGDGMNLPCARIAKRPCYV